MGLQSTTAGSMPG